jgi:hypothetical protein
LFTGSARGWLVCVTLAVAGACSRRDAASASNAAFPTPDVVTTAVAEPGRRDSAGIVFVENHGIAWTAATRWRLAASPLLDLGAGMHGDADNFYSQPQAVRLDDGRVIVAVVDPDVREIRVFDKTGAPAGAWTGGAAQGVTGRGMRGFATSGRPMRHLPGDSVLVDAGSAGLALFDSSGHMQRQILRVAPDISGVSFSVEAMRVQGRFADGSLLITRAMPRPTAAQTGVEAWESMLLRVDESSAVRDSLGVIFTDEMFIQAVNGRRRQSEAGFGRHASIGVFGNEFYYGDPRTGDIRVYTSTGALRRIIRATTAPRAVGPTEIAAYKRLRLAARDSTTLRDASDAPQIVSPFVGMGAAFMRRDEQARLDAMAFPSTAPAFQRLLVDAGGNLWVEHYRMPGVTQPSWTVFDPAGRQLGDVDTPRGFEVLQIGRDFVLGRRVDEMEAPHVVVYALGVGGVSPR